MSNTCTRQELEEFLSYVHRAEHDVLLRQLIKKVYDDLKDSGSVSTHVDEQGRLVLTEPEWLVRDTAVDPPEPATAQEVKRKKTGTIARYLVAALLLIMAGTIWIINRSVNKNATALSSLTKKATDRSESKFLLLTDSTQVWLNAVSSLEYPDQFDNKKREVFLTGEAFFDVKHAEDVPFIIHTGNISTMVLGTAFNIKAYPGQKNITISVSRGKVKVMRKDGWQVVLTKGQQVKLNETGTVSSEQNIPTEMIAGWQQGNIIYDDEPLKDIITDMERIYNVNIHISNSSLEGLGITTSFKREIGVEQSLQALCKLTDTKLIKKDNGYLIQ